jgi:hypothetical protein
MSNAEEIAAQQVIQVHDLSEVCKGKFQRVKFDLDLSSKHIGADGATKLAAAMQLGLCTGLRDLNLEYNSIGADGATKLAAAMQLGLCTGLRDLNLSYDQIGADGATKLAAAMQSGGCPGLRDLNLYNNHIGDDGATKLAAAMKSGQCPGLRDLNLYNNHIGDDGATELAAAMQSGQCPGLRDLDLSENWIGDDGATKLAAAMQSGQCPRLRDLDLSLIDIGPLAADGNHVVNGISSAVNNLMELAEVLGSGECPELSRAEFVSRAVRYPNFVHAPARWSISQHLPRAHIVARDMLSCPPDGTCATRWLVVVLMVAAFCAPALLPADTTSATLTLSDTQNATRTGVFAVTVLSDVCDVVPEELAGFYIDPVAGLEAVIALAILFVCCARIKKCYKAHMKTKSIQKQTKEEGDKKEPKPLLSSKSARALNLLVQLLCACFLLGEYLVWSDVGLQGTPLCRVFGRVTLAIFYKPLVPAMW